MKIVLKLTRLYWA